MCFVFCQITSWWIPKASRPEIIKAVLAASILMTNWRYFAVPGEKNYSYVLFGSFFVYRINEIDVSITRHWIVPRKKPEFSFSACFHLRSREGVHSLQVSSSYRPQKDVKLSLPHCPLFSCFTCHSCDGVIKIWDRDKTLLREIIMDDTLTVASFLNQRGKNYFFTPNTLLKPCIRVCHWCSSVIGRP